MSLFRNLARRCSNLILSPDALRAMAGPILRLRGFRRQDGTPRLSSLRNILVIRVDEIGDFVMTTPFLRELRRNCPDARITLVVKLGVMGLAETCPYVNEVIAFNPDARSAVRWRRITRAFRLARQKLWPVRFDAAILPRWDADSGHATYLAYFSGAPYRLGYAENVSAFRRTENVGYDRLLTHTLPDVTLKHEVEHNLDVLRALGGRVECDRLELWLKPEDESLAEKALAEIGREGNGPLIAFGLGVREPRRRWPAERFAEVARWLMETEQARVLTLPGPGEESFAECWRSQVGMPAATCIGGTTLRQAAAILKRCRLFVGNDSSLKHLAAAVGVPCVEVHYFPVERSAGDTHGMPVERFHPWGVPYRVSAPDAPRDPCTDDCRASEPHCILGIGVSRVQDAINALRDDWRGAL